MIISIECIDVGQYVKFHKALVNSGFPGPWSRIPSPWGHCFYLTV